ncbi:SDR family oxidoreductase [Phormidium yuhuli AB48]|uniref:SDR family oxidoreductase n=1 Tax=Phormidium yuhuli AB48 TaxID=2940671 RepID=A0ABY5ARK4_9CYAN|nr:SDR family oxidoreductase [Phormidium yuhuli]USR91844.1 SDR family oxidoreductase [Phormidium yuhuli AB48]
MTSTQGQLALITGASSGIGKATALAFAEAGINLALLSRSQDKLEQVAIAARELGVTAEVFPCDLLDVEQLRDRFATLAQKLGKVDILVNNAGIGYINSLSDTSLADWERVFRLNVTSVLEATCGILPTMRAKGGGVIINVSSIAGKQAFPNWGAYSASKFALMGFSQSLAAEEREHGIRVTAICPGAVNTPIWETDTMDKAGFDRNSMLTPDAVAQAILQAVQLPQGAVLEEMTIMPSGGAF